MNELKCCLKLLDFHLAFSFNIISPFPPSPDIDIFPKSLTFFNGQLPTTNMVSTAVKSFSILGKTQARLKIKVSALEVSTTFLDNNPNSSEI